MDKQKTVLILGAGASHSYGFPVGSGLRQMILNLCDQREITGHIGFGSQAIRTFVDSFKASQSYSIDSFLGRRSEFVEIGKAAIAYVLLECEGKADLLNEKNTDHWYQYLVNQLTTEAWDSFDPSWLSIVTFNYDRSLIQYLVTAIQHNYNKTQEEVVERLKSLKIVHVYGSLGAPFPYGNGCCIPFGEILEVEKFSYIKEAVKGLVIIPEGRDDAATVQDARREIESAVRIGMLGFGFDPINIQRLGSPRVFLQENYAGYRKHTVATCLGLTAAEKMKAIHNLFGQGCYQPVQQLENFHEKNCIDTLRETLILD